MLQQFQKYNKCKLILIAIIAIPIILSILSYPLFRCLWWILEHFIQKTWYFYFICIVVPIVINIASFLFMGISMFSKSTKTRFLLNISSDYQLFIMLLIVFVVILEIVFGVSSSAHQYAWIVCIAIIGVIVVYLFISDLIGTFILRNKYVDIKSSKLKQPLRIIHISDTHIGSRSQSFLDKVVQQVNELQGDIICITGDLVDSVGVISEVIPDYQNNQQSDKSVLQPNPYPVLRSLEKLTAKVGVYFVIGNHDFYLGKENVVKMIQHFPNIRLLSNEYVDISLHELNSSDQSINQSNQNENQSISISNQIRIIGFDDGNPDQFTKEVNDFININQNSSFNQNETSESIYTIILHHQPHKRAWLKAMDLLHGDLFLAGHTHNGQIFPGNLLVYLFFPHPAGLLTIKANNKKDELKYDQQQYEVNKQEQLHLFDRHLYVNPGTGTWGSPARSSGFSEITIINISPE